MLLVSATSSLSRVRPAIAAALLLGTATAQLPDLSVESVVTTGVEVDAQSLIAGGLVDTRVANLGGPASSCAVVAFEDKDRSGAFEPGNDNVLGKVVIRSAAAGATLALQIPVSGTVLFRDNRIYVAADAYAELAESNETNNLAHDRPGCAQPDLSSCLLRIPPCTGGASQITVRVGNGGSVRVRPNLPVSFYNGDPAAPGGAFRIGTLQTQRALPTGAFVDMTLPLPAGFPYRGIITVVADDLGELNGTLAECDESNNSHAVPVCRTQASWSNYGSGWPGRNGVPSLTLDRTPVLGTDVEVRVGNASGVATQGCLIWGAAAAARASGLGGTVLVDYAAVTPLSLSPARGSWNVTIPCDTRFCGLRVYLQGAHLDDAASQGVAFTPGLELIPGRP